MNKAVPMIRFQNCFKRYANGREALNNLTLDVEAGEFAFLTGHSGAGKSTLLKLLALIERPTRGALLVNGQNVLTIKCDRIAAHRRQLGMVFQDHKLLSDRSIFDNVSLPLIVANTPVREIGKRVRAALDQVGLLKYEQSRPIELSTGEQQRVGLARAVVTKPPLLIADEPTGNLDPDLSLEVMNILRRFQEVGVTVLVASHNVQLIERFKARRIHLEGGRLVEDMGKSVMPDVVNVDEDEPREKTVYQDMPLDE
ncbi:MAG: cell division ATP-binding protein FtsE [Steroidobacter sp.]